MARDFFGDYVAPGMVVAGAGVTAYRTYKDISSKGTLTAPWRAQRAASSTYKKIMAARENRHFRTAEQVASLFFPGAGTETAADAINLIRGSTVKGLVRSFNLERTAIGLGINLENPASVTQGQLTSLIGGSADKPLGTRFYREHLERVASYNKLNLLTPSHLQGGSKRSQTALEELQHAYSQIDTEGGKLVTVGELKKSGGFANSSIAGLDKPEAYSRMKKGFQEEFRNREGLTSRVQELYERIQQMNKTLPPKQRIKMKLATMEESGRMFYTGVRIEANKRVLPTYFEDEERVIRFGARSKGVAKYVAAKDIRTNMRTFDDPFKIARRVDEAMIDLLLDGGLEQFLDGSIKGGSFWKKFVSSNREDTNKPIMRITSNKALNQRYANQMVLSPSAMNPNLSDDEMEAISNRFRHLKLNPTLGLSANQRTARNFAMPTRTGHVPGASPIGFTGDNKSVAQTLRERVIVGGRSRYRRTPALFGVRQTAAGDITTRLRTYSMPDIVANTLLSMTNRADIHLHEDEFILSDTLTYKETKSLGTFGPDSPMNKKIAKLARAKDGIMANMAAHLRSGMPEGYLEEMLAYREELRGHLGEAPDVTSRAFQDFTELDEALESVTLKPGDYIGTGPDGRIATVPSNAKHIYLTSMKEEVVDGQSTIRLSGEMYRDAARGDKLMAFKGIIKAQTGWKYTEKLAALYEANRYDPRLISAIEAKDGDAIRALFDPQLAQISKAEQEALQAGENFHLGDAFKGTPVHHKWQQAARNVGGTQILSVQGVKKIGDANMANLTHGLMEELFDEALTIRDDKLESVKEDISKLHVLDEDFLSSPRAIKIREQRLRRLELKKSALEGRLNAIRELGYTINPQTGTPQIIDNGKYNMVDRFEKVIDLTMHSPSRRGRWSPQQFFKDLSVSKNLTAFGEHTADILAGAKGSVLEAGHIYRKLHSAGAFAGGTARQEWGAALEKQVMWGSINRTVGMHGSPALTGGSGRQGSFNLQTLGHTQAQGGVVSDMGVELAGRLTSDKADEASAIFKRSAYFDMRGSTTAVSLDELAGSDLSRETVERLFSPNQAERSEAFGAVRSKFGLGESDGLVFGTGHDTHKYIFHPEEISSHTGGFTTPSGIHKATPIDEALREMILSSRMGNKDRTKGVAAYGDALAEISIGKTQAPAKAYSGHVQGSLRLQAQSNANRELFPELANYIDENYANKVGIRESLVEQMAEDMGIAGDRDELISQLRRGELASLIHRSPDTEMHRISSVQMFSIDDVLEKYTSKITSAKTSSELMHTIWQLDERRHERLTKRLAEIERVVAEAHEASLGIIAGNTSGIEQFHRASTEKGRGNKKARRAARQNLKAEVARVNAEHGYNIRLGSKGNLDRTSYPQGSGLNAEAQKHRAITESLASFYKGQHEGTFAWLPKQIEQVLGADYDDDQISIFLAKDKSARARLQERAAYQERLLGGWQQEMAANELRPEAERLQAGIHDESFIESMRNSGGLSAEQKYAEEDFLYKIRQNELYANLKSKDPSVITREALIEGSESWKLRARAQDMMAHLEKAQIGSMSNATDFARAMFRRMGRPSTSAGANTRLFAEMLMGIMPESILKVRQVPMHQVEAVGTHSDHLKRALRGEFGSSPQAIENFQGHFRALHGAKPGTIVDRIASPEHIRVVLEAAEKARASKEEFSLLTALKNDIADNGTRQAAMQAASDGTASSIQHELYRDATRGIGEEISPLQRNIKNTAASFSDAYDIMLKHKKPLLLGAGLALATSMVLGSTGSISSEEADAAGARHSSGHSTVPPTDMGHSARVSSESGRAVRVRGSSSGEIDPSVIAAKLGERFPGAGVNFTVNDYRERINQEYIRKRLDR